MEDNELECEQVVPKTELHIPDEFQLITRYEKDDKVVYQINDLFFTGFYNEDKKIGYHVKKADGSDPSEREMANVHDAMLFIIAEPANLLPA